MKRKAIQLVVGMNSTMNSTLRDELISGLNGISRFIVTRPSIVASRLLDFYMLVKRPDETK